MGDGGTRPEWDDYPGWERDRRRQVKRRRMQALQRRRRRRAVAGLSILIVLLAAALAVAWPGSEDGESAGAAPGSEVPAEQVSDAAPAADAPAGQSSDAQPPSPTTTMDAAAAGRADTVVEIGWVGDLTPGSQYGNPPDAGRALFEHTRDYTLQPDIMVANLEGTFGTGGASKCDGKDSSACYAFQAPPENAVALAWAGIDVVNLANNHSYDYFDAGVEATKQALAANGIDYTGMLDTVAVREVQGVRVAFIGFSPYSRSPDIGDLAAAAELVREVDANADVVVVLMHAGAEGADQIHTPTGGETAYGEFRGDSRAFSRAVIDAGADLVLGSGPHVVRGIEEYQGRLIAYSLGNFAGWKNFSRKGSLALSGLLTVRVAGDGRVLGGRWLSLRIAEPGVPVVDSAGESLGLVRRLSEEDFETPVNLGDDGAFSF